MDSMRHARHFTDIRTQTREVDGYRYTYTLMCSHENEVVSYCIRIHLCTPEGEESATTFSEGLADGGRALLLFRLLVRELVTPIDLPYVIEDMYDL